MAVKLPENKPQAADITPKIIFVWGESMGGKTYMAREFPDPIILNTDGNAKKTTTPSVEINDFKHFEEYLQLLLNGGHTYKTIIIDLVDDILTMLQQHICKKYNVEHEGEIPYGRGYNEVTRAWKNLMMMLSKSKYNIIFVSHIMSIQEGNKTTEIPSLSQRHECITKGRCDVSIQCKKVGETYLRICRHRRDAYTPTQIKDPAIRKIMETVVGLFNKQAITKKEDAEKIVKELGVEPPKEIKEEK